MRREALFIQGGGEGAHDHWDKKLVQSLERDLGPNHVIRYPRMPREADPHYAAWKAALKVEFRQLGEGSILVGHSIGGTMLIHALAEEPPDWMPLGVFLIAAPFLGEGGWQSDEIAPMTDLGARLPAQMSVYLYQGTDDDTTPLEHAALYQRAIPQAVMRRLTGRNHQLNNDLSEVAADVRRL